MEGDWGKPTNLRSAACRPSSTTPNWRSVANLRSRGSARASGSAEESKADLARSSWGGGVGGA